jgi:ABC-type uncharacterized transport system substrate-binding protein
VLLLAALLLVAGRPGYAHPHVFVDYALLLVLGTDGAMSAQMTWAFDELSSGMLLDDLGVKKGKRPPAVDVTALALKQFPDLRGDRFFLDVKVDGAPLRVAAVRDFRANVEGDRMRYTFTVPIPLRNPREGVIEVRVDDPSYFVAFEPRQEAPVRWTAPPAFVVACRVVPGEGIYEGTLIRCTYRRRAP